MLPPLPEKEWTRAHALHLLNRAGFGGSPATVDEYARMGVVKAVQKLVNPPDTTEQFPPPKWATPRNMLAFRREARRHANCDEDAMRMQFQKFQREQRLWLAELQNWWLQRMLSSPAPFLEKMTLFWHGHFATSAQKVKQTYFMWLQNETLRHAALGRFGDLVKAVSRDPAMIEWLDLRQSHAGKPNENFARELLELFTLGEGHYTEEDIKQTARAFTGYKINPVNQSFRFAVRDHDSGEKTIFGRSGAFDGDAVIDIILDNPQCARFLTRKIWEHFAIENPPDTVVDQLATAWREVKYDIRALMTSIFRSAAFYSPAIRAKQIKSPVQFLIQLAKQSELKAVPTMVAFQAMRALSQILFVPPNVKGWDGGKAWITTSTLFARYNFAGQLIGADESTFRNDRERRIMKFAENNGFQPSVARPELEKLAPPDLVEDPCALVDALCLRFYGVEIPAKEKAPFVEFAASRFPMDNAAVAALIHLIMSTPRYQLC